MNYAGILAGGKGTRMGITERPKQFLRLGAEEKPIIIYTIEAFLTCKDIDRIIIATPLAWVEYTEVLVYENFDEESCSRITVIQGGKERSDSLDNICTYIEDTWGLTDDDILVSHDAVRPFVTQRIIEENVRFAREVGCVDTVVPSTDTIVVSVEGKTIDEIPPRSQFYQGQTPQSFSIKEYLEAYNALTDEQKAILTDACKVYLFNNKPVHLVMGEYSNIKITTPYDIHVAESILSERGAK
ncbi:IspD/TarI family cytidylyltransferase [Slackia heliotrinireducens]|uniref:4-diphosphocytidyl-2-methyl-D-erythritol synthase n=1 Tax=Slackia heliotrinireducens (strain ATCC 29202 / DSM 20476 / NCTC 11029 / RHS 1) TaxID=471855 RepID=C7N6E7_SLAHD|nr:2-C-methyl-D-erythritol 4-phosphate cytidylyltransferase [Slackia heliotrinireducens]ACV22482.1 4-diphosphocytidyl-2-methyl-D-erythritol synthase [Slackia heliotrinireducens DSM 20476]VEH00880.1 2-C-methyl-D-erythritol 4-phosphate cytidylyltransferase 2 [Slackia heliotrinireducens]